MLTKSMQKRILKTFYNLPSLVVQSESMFPKRPRARPVDPYLCWLDLDDRNQIWTSRLGFWVHFCNNQDRDRCTFIVHIARTRIIAPSDPCREIIARTRIIAHPKVQDIFLVIFSIVWHNYKKMASLFVHLASIS